MSSRNPHERTYRLRFHLSSISLPLELRVTYLNRSLLVLLLLLITLTTTACGTSVATPNEATFLFFYTDG